MYLSFPSIVTNNVILTRRVHLSEVELNFHINNMNRVDNIIIVLPYSFNMLMYLSFLQRRYCHFSKKKKKNTMSPAEMRYIYNHNHKY